jgi:hypothetical protein
MAEISRRTLLAALAGLAAGAGLGLAKGIRHKVAVPPPAPPAALTDALARQQRLLAGYDAVLSGHYAGWPALGSMRSDVVAHGDALRALLERYPGWRLASATTSASPEPTGPPAGRTTAPPPSLSASGMTVDRLAVLTAADAKAVTGAALAWPATEQHAGEVVPTLGSIAACLASHAQELTG